MHTTPEVPELDPMGPVATWEDWRAEMAYLRAELAEDGERLAEMGVERTAGLLRAMRWEAAFGDVQRMVDARPAFVVGPPRPTRAPFVPVAPVRVSVRDVIRGWANGLSRRSLGVAA